MAEKDQDDLLTLVDEEGAEHRFSVYEVLEVDDQSYFILRPEEDGSEEEDEDAVEYLVFRVESVSGEDQLVLVDDDEELERVAAAWEDLEEDWDEAPKAEPPRRRLAFLHHPLYGGLAGGAFILLLLFVYFSAPAAWPGAAAVPVRVAAGSGTRAIGNELQKQGVIRSVEHFIIWARVLNAESDLQAGLYMLSPSLPPQALVLRLKNGRVTTRGVTIPEGYNLKQIAAALADADVADEKRFLELAATPETALAGMQLPFAPPADSLEGYLFPDTYRFAPGTPEPDIIRIMVGRMVQVVAPLVADKGLPAGFTWHDLLTLAALVEKEAQAPAERPLIAGVFLKRLQIGMPLQSDPSVKYAMADPPVRLSLADIALDSPYNTYKYSGLPPGPIASPGADAIAAVLSPEKTDYLYFVAHGDGTHIFSRTYQEHLAARRSIAAASQ